MANTAFSYVEQLWHTQWLGPKELGRYQQPLIERLVRHAALQTSFYPDRLAPLFGGGNAATSSIDFSRWTDVPVVRRIEAIDLQEQMAARSVPPDTGGIKAGQSSGSTGRPFTHLRSEAAIFAANCTLHRVYECFDVDLSGSLAFITLDRERQCPYPAGGQFKGWNQTVPDAGLFILDINTPPDQQLEWLERVGPDHVMTYPVTLREVAEIVLERGANLRFKTFISTGELLDAESREIISRAFGCLIIDVYGAREIGTIAFQCPIGGGYHICAETVVCELVDDAGRPVPPGEYGRVVLTGLYNYAMPFIRYDVGDYALASTEPCPCGRGLPKLDRIGGRTRNFFVMPDGSRKRLRGALVAEAAKYLAYRQIQFVQTAVDTVQINYVPDGSDQRTDFDSLSGLLRQEFHDAVTIQLVPTQKIERSAGMKLEQFVSLVTPGDVRRGMPR